MREGAIIDAAGAHNIRVLFDLGQLDLSLKFRIVRYDIVVAMKEAKRRF